LSQIKVAGGSRAAADARAALTESLAGRVAAARLHDLRLLATEAVTNSVRHGGVVDETDWVKLTVSATRDNVRVEVRDSGAQGLPVPQPLELDREGGFGLFLIDQLADSWGVENEPSLCVWFEVSTR